MHNTGGKQHQIRSLHHYKMTMATEVNNGQKIT